MVVTHVSDKLLFSARLFMKKASWGYCVLLFDSSGELAARPGTSDSFALDGSGTEFEVAHTTSCEEGADATMDAPMDHESSMGQIYCCIRQDLSQFSSLLFFRSNTSPGS